MVQEYTYREGIFCKILYQVYKLIEICNFVLWYHKNNYSANVYYDLAYPNKIAIKRIRSLKVKQVHFSFVENRQNTEHGVLEKTSWEHAWDLLDLILPSAEGFLHPKLQVCNLITYTVCVSITNWKAFMTLWLFDNDQMTVTMKSIFSAKIMHNVMNI